MKTYHVLSQGLSEFKLQDENQQNLGSLQYEKWFSFDAKISTLYDESVVKMEGFWLTDLVQYDENKLKKRRVKTTWTGFAIEEISGLRYFLAWKGWSGMELVLKDGLDRKVLGIKSSFDWKKLNSNYEIQIEDFAEIEPDFILLMIHCINYQMTLIAGM